MDGARPRWGRLWEEYLGRVWSGCLGVGTRGWAGRRGRIISSCADIWGYQAHSESVLWSFGPGTFGRNYDPTSKHP